MDNISFPDFFWDLLVRVSVLGVCSPEFLALPFAAAEVVRAMEELRGAGQSEYARRVELESALREATSIFKKELFARNEQIATLEVWLASKGRFLHNILQLLRVFQVVCGLKCGP